MEKKKKSGMGFRDAPVFSSFLLSHLERLLLPQRQGRVQGRGRGGWVGGVAERDGDVGDGEGGLKRREGREFERAWIEKREREGRDDVPPPTTRAPPSGRLTAVATAARQARRTVGRSMAGKGVRKKSRRSR